MDKKLEIGHSNLLTLLDYQAEQIRDPMNGQYYVIQ